MMMQYQISLILLEPTSEESDLDGQLVGENSSSASDSKQEIAAQGHFCGEGDESSESCTNEDQLCDQLLKGEGEGCGGGARGQGRGAFQPHGTSQG